MTMTDSADRQRRRGPAKLSELVGRVLDPVTARRGFATADLIAAWPEIVGKRFAACTRPERIQWPRGADVAGGGLLTVAVEGPRAVLIQHEIGQIIERINAFLGYGAIAKVRLVQAPVEVPRGEERSQTPLGTKEASRLAETIVGVEDDGLRAALDRLGRGVLSGG